MELTERRGLYGSALKWIAIATMFIDHVAVVLVYGLAKYNHAWGAGLLSKDGYFFLRGVGRLGFPLFCFLLAEGFYHSRSRWKYLLRLAIFALISEIPFDLAFNGAWLEFGDQNVFFTLSLGLLAAMLWNLLTQGNEKDCPPWRGFAAILCAVALGAAAHYMNTDYGAMGVALILVMALLRDKPLTRDLVSGGVLAAMIPFGSHWIELFGMLAFPLFHAYNGHRGRQSKYFFYIFYPAHLLALALIARYLFRA